MATTLIAYKIHTSSTQWTGISSNHRFQRIITILVESAAAYSLSVLVFAIFNVTPASDDLRTPLSYGKLYAQAIVTVVGGMAPTVLVARIALSRIGQRDVIIMGSQQ
uniref:Uncharacterized protein n=1 Tax=Psilocybe cubensis TaxID=181762 RepID=A0A8H7XNQ9_PSICU